MRKTITSKEILILKIYFQNKSSQNFLNAHLWHSKTQSTSLFLAPFWIKTYTPIFLIPVWDVPGRLWRPLTVLILFFPRFFFDPLKNIRKPKVFWCFQGVKRDHWEKKGCGIANKHKKYQTHFLIPVMIFYEYLGANHYLMAVHWYNWRSGLLLRNNFY